jgi:ubiquitin conjugation factor E4 B
MLNVLSVLQILSERIKLETVDPLYPFHPSSLISVVNDTRLWFTNQEATTWLEQLSEYEL